MAGRAALRMAEPDPAADAPRAVQPALLPTPPLATGAAEAAGMDGFLLKGALVDAWFLKRSDVLVVSFDNLSSIGEYDPPQPWLQMRAANAGLSILGLIASRKDWYLNDDTETLLTGLREAGFFARFRRVVLIGASMGGFAAWSYARLIPGAAVLAFSPQSTLGRKRAPFETRYRYASRKWDWKGHPFRDAAEAHPVEAWLVYDPFVAEDRAHAARLAGPGVTVIAAPHMGHRAIRQLKSVGVLQQVIEGVAKGQFDPLAFARAYRARRGVLAWQRALLAEAARRGHNRLGLAAAKHLIAQDESARFLRRAVEQFRAALAAPGDETLTVPGAAAPFTGEIQVLHRALVLPERDHDEKLASGVLRADGSYAPLSRAWIRARKSTPAPRFSADEPVADLPGRHLFAGHFRGHFGHFLVESTARLWALDHVPGGVDSLLYLPYRGEVGAIERAIEAQQGFFDILGIAAPVRTFGTALRVERLYLPELGFGWLERYAGSPAYRAFMQGRLRAAVPAEGGERLYVSRARLNAARGGVLGEAVIEENLARAGYEIFHPEKHPLSVQIARYKAAKVIVALDGSALHLAAYVMPEGGRVAMILRRSKANAADYILQYQNFCGITPQVIDVIRHDWVAGEAGRVDFRSVGELDFAALFDRLKAAGLLPAEFRPDLPDQAQIAAMLASYEDKRGAPFRALTPGERLAGEEDA